jgi:CheY-like chemotaxis protein
MTRVLVVDDSAATRRIVRRALTTSGVPNACIREAVNGIEALARIAEDPPQLVLSDVNMPLMDGFELLEEMQNKGYIGTIPVVMITTRSSIQDRNRLVGLGAETVIRKPFPVHALRTYIEPYLAQPLVPKSVARLRPPPVVAIADDEIGAFGEEEFAEALSSSLAITLELAAFLQATPTKRLEQAELPEVYYYAEIAITRGHYGRLWIAGPAGAVDQFVDAGVARAGQDNVVAYRADALTEFLNALAGEFCAELLGNQSDYAFGLPTCDVLLSSDTRLHGGSVFCLDEPKDVVLIGYRPGAEVCRQDLPTRRKS